MTVICTMALILLLNPLIIQIAMNISESPIKIVDNRELSLPKILETICSCRGTKFKTLHKNPFANQTAAIRYVRILCLFFLLCTFSFKICFQLHLIFPFMSICYFPIVLTCKLNYTFYYFPYFKFRFVD